MCDDSFTILEHQERCENRLVAQLAELFSLRQGVTPKVAKQIKISASLHDVGKQKIPENILYSPGKLDKQEFEIMKTHTTLGAEILQNIQGELGVMARKTALYHHEWYNGKGYFGKPSGELPVYVAITSICDVFIALVSKRVYKSAWTLNESLEYIQNQAGTQFDPKLVKGFVSLIRKEPRVSVIMGTESDAI